MAETIAEQLAKFICGLDYQGLPAEVIEKARECILDQLGCELVGSTLGWNKIIYDFITGAHGAEECTIVNYGTKALAHEAAFVNATFGQGAELDDGLEGGGSHPGSAGIPVALALGEREHLDGKAFLTSLVAGYDLAYHLGRGMVPHLQHRGFHGQSVIGVFIATAVAGKLLKLNVTEMTHALAIAGSHASGTMEYDQSGGEVKRMHTGLAVRGGMESAALAKMGLTGPPTIFEGKRGIMPVFAEGYDAKAITEKVGQEFGVMHAYFKKHPVAGPLQSSIEVLAALIKEHGIKAKDVDRIDVGLNERFILHGAGISVPHDTIGAQFSLAFSLAIRLLKGSNALSLYADPALWRDPQVLALSKKVHAYADPEAKGATRYASRIRITLTSGKIVEGKLPYPKGTPRNPLTREEREEKFGRLAGTVLPRERVVRIVRMVDDVEQLRDMADLAALLVGQRG